MTNDINFDRSLLLELLDKKIVEPKLSDREKEILLLVENGSLGTVLQMKKTFSNRATQFCPYCLQDTTTEHKENLLKNIETILNEKVQEHIKKLEEFKIEQISFDYKVYENLDPILIKKIRQNIDSINLFLNKYNEDVQKKINKVFMPIIIDYDHSEIYKTLMFDIAKLEELRQAYNKTFDELEIIKSELILVNNSIAYYQILETYKEYTEQKIEYNINEENLKVIEKEKNRIESDLTSLIQRQESTDIAIEFINNGLKYIFFSDNRLTIKGKDNKYFLYSNGKPVKPTNISSGERNALALCYYFTLMLTNMNEKDLYENSSLLIIDDPISSFDIENQIGILSYLKSQILRIINGNPDSKVLILSHDLLTVENVKKIFEEISKSISDRSNGSIKPKSNKKIIDRFSLKQYTKTELNNYSQLLRKIYDYAIYDYNDRSESTNKPVNDLVIGNIMRRVLEAFSTFEYKKGLIEVSYDEVIINSLHESHREYFENLMYRIVLNEESHFESSAQNPYKLNFFDFLSTNEKQRTAKDILSFMYLLNPIHLTCHLGNKAGEKDRIEEWCGDIKKTTKVN